MNPVNPGPQTMATASHHVPPAGRQPRPRRKSLEQLEAKYKALMRNMLMYQQLRKRNMCEGAGAGPATNIKTEAGATGRRMDEKTQQQQQQQLMFQAQQTLPTPASSVSPSSSTTNLDDAKPNQPQHQHHHQNSTPGLREQQRERPPQKRLQNANSGPKPAYDRREPGSSARHARPAGRPMPAAIQLAYEELASMQRQQTPPPPQPQPHHQQQQQQQQPQHQYQQQQHQQQQQSTQQSQQSHQGSAPIPIPRPANIQIPPHYLQQQYIHHVSPHLSHHQPLASPLPTPPHLTASYTAHHSLPTIPAPYASYDTSGLQAHMDQQQQQQSHSHSHSHSHPHSHHPHQPHQQQQQHGMTSYEPNSNVDGDLLDCFVSNMGDM
ncbi:hypothetical protein F5Y07DRAFT_317383 [Xylaria sp. FL0933]|nr:hypothetical protein F5Y07DRAFT_317383 [Xylaria sp. FL0933]